MISLALVSVCSNPACRLVLPADPDDEPNAGFWVHTRRDGRAVRWASRCKDCVRRAKRNGREPRRRSSVVGLEMCEGRLVQIRRCACGAEGPALDSPDSLFPVNTRDGKGNAIGWKSLCRTCHNEAQRARWKDPVKAAKMKATARRRYAKRMAEDPAYVESRRKAARRFYAEHPERREQVRQWNFEHPARRREIDRLSYATRREREGRPVRPRRDPDVKRRFLPSAPLSQWMGAYRTVHADLTYEELARSLGLMDRMMRSYEAAERPWVEFDAVDRIIGGTTVVVEVDGRPIYGIDDLYPGDPGIPWAEIVPSIRKSKDGAGSGPLG